MVCSLHSVTTGSRDRANVSLINGTEGSRSERQPLITPGDARTSANPTYSANARLVDLHSSYVCDFVWFAFLLLLLIVFFLQYRRVRYGVQLVFCFYFWQLDPRDDVLALVFLSEMSSVAYTNAFLP